jgi:predicted Fe-Mo cluster-binding NifX family protein
VKLRVACATDNGEDLINRHFGDAESYLIYDVDDQNYEKVKEINNSTEEHKGDEEDVHADSEKARNIKELLKEEGVQVLLSRQFGPNIKSVRNYFVPVIAKKLRLIDAVKMLKNNLHLVKHQWQKEEERKHIVLDGNNYHRS